MSTVAAAISQLEERLGDRAVKLEDFRGQSVVEIRSDSILEACAVLRELDFDLLVALTAVDHWPDEPRFEVVYRLYSTTSKEIVGLRTLLTEEPPELSSVESIYPNANWHEREVFDMFGIHFSDHSDLRRILMPHDWEGHPLRRDYPLGYEEVQFTFNYDEIDKRKKYAKD